MFAKGDVDPPDSTTDDSMCAAPGSAVVHSIAGRRRRRREGEGTICTRAGASLPSPGSAAAADMPRAFNTEGGTDFLEPSSSTDADVEDLKGFAAQMAGGEAQGHVGRIGNMLWYVDGLENGASI